MARRSDDDGPFLLRHGVLVEFGKISNLHRPQWNIPSRLMGNEEQ
jgi:hypothetical protein